MKNWSNFQGDPVLLFLCICTQGAENRKNGPVLNPLHFMEELKLFAKSEIQIDSIGNSVRM